MALKSSSHFPNSDRVCLQDPAMPDATRRRSLASPLALVRPGARRLRPGARRLRPSKWAGLPALGMGALCSRALRMLQTLLRRYSDCGQTARCNVLRRAATNPGLWASAEP